MATLTEKLEAELAPLEGRSAAAHMKYQGELETKVVKLTKERDKLREAIGEAAEGFEAAAEGHGVNFFSYAGSMRAALLESSDE